MTSLRRVVALLAWAFLPSTVAAQHRASLWPDLDPPTPFLQTAEGVGPSVAVVGASSAVLPGLGQLLMDQRRGWAYLALEAVGWWAWTNRRSAGADGRQAYRDFAWEQGRFQSSDRVEGDFDYYETMSNWDRSGLFDADPAAGGVQPETDTGTFNGSVWSLATRLFPELPGGGSEPRPEALAYYQERAYGAELGWDWSTGGPGARDRFGELIEDSDAKYRQATNVLGAILAHHVVSGVDAFLSARTRDQLRLGVYSMPRDGVQGWGVHLSVPVR
ncbi:MAG: hypothetical protein AAF389_19975 [Gemmatimonadota bacterium]